MSTSPTAPQSWGTWWSSWIWTPTPSPPAPLPSSDPGVASAAPSVLLFLEQLKEAQKRRETETFEHALERRLRLLDVVQKDQHARFVLDLLLWTEQVQPSRREEVRRRTQGVLEKNVQTQQQ